MAWGVRYICNKRKEGVFIDLSLIKKMKVESKKADLYYSILNYGVDNMANGLTLIELKSKLSPNYEELESFINSVFLTNFSPIDQNANQLGTLSAWDVLDIQVENANRNKFRINVDSVSEFLKIQHSYKNLRSAKISRCISTIALVISTGILGIGLYSYNQGRITSKNTLDCLQSIDSKIQSNYYFKLDTNQLNTILCNTSKYQKETDSLKLSKLNSINWKLLDIKK